MGTSLESLTFISFGKKLSWSRDWISKMTNCKLIDWDILYSHKINDVFFAINFFYVAVHAHVLKTSMQAQSSDQSPTINIIITIII